MREKANEKRPDYGGHFVSGTDHHLINKFRKTLFELASIWLFIYENFISLPKTITGFWDLLRSAAFRSASLFLAFFPQSGFMVLP